MNAVTAQRSVPRFLVFAFCLGLADVSRGQTPAVPSSETRASNDLPALRVAVSSINETRRQGAGTINLVLSITGEGLPPDVVVKAIIVTKAVDNLGNVLGSSGPWGVSIGGSNLGVGRGGPLAGRVSLAAPVRKAESLAYVEGIIELFLPSEANDGSTIRLPSALSRAGGVEDPALAKQKLESFFVSDQASYDRAKNQAAGVQAKSARPELPNGVGYSLRDLSGGLVSQQLQETNRTPIRPGGVSGTSSGGNIRPVAPPPTEAQQVVFIASPAATKTVPFRVEEIALP